MHCTYIHTYIHHRYPSVCLNACTHTHRYFPQPLSHTRCSGPASSSSSLGFSFPLFFLTASILASRSAIFSSRFLTIAERSRLLFSQKLRLTSKLSLKAWLANLSASRSADNYGMWQYNVIVSVQFDFVYTDRSNRLNGRSVLSVCLTAFWQNGGEMIA